MSEKITRDMYYDLISYLREDIAYNLEGNMSEYQLKMTLIRVRDRLSKMLNHVEKEMK